MLEAQPQALFKEGLCRKGIAFPQCAVAKPHDYAVRKISPARRDDTRLDFAHSALRITFRLCCGDVAEWLKAAVC